MLKKLVAILLSLSLMTGAGQAVAAGKKTYWQCVTFARSITGMDIYGDAWTWWEKASGKYERGHAPKAGSVLVFRPQGKMSLGHVAVVSQIVTERIIQITHANWSPIGGRRGQVEENVTVVDVSEKGDWSKVKVWYAPIGDLGTTTYPVYGFIYAEEEPRPLIAQVLEKQDGADESAAIRTSAKVNAGAVAAKVIKPDFKPYSATIKAD